MRVLMTCHTDFDENTGALGCTVNIGRGLESSGVAVDYYTYNDLPKKLDIRLKRCLFPFFVYGHVQRYKKWDIIDATTADTWVLGKAKAKGRKPKIVISSHGLEHMFENIRIVYEKKTSVRYKSWIRLHLKLVESSLKSADHICVLTHAEKEYMKSRFFIPQDKISVVYHSLPAHFMNLSEHHLPNEFKILYVGGWEERKGIRYLLEAMESLLGLNFNFSVTLAGLRIDEAMVWRKISEKLRPHVKIIPFIENRHLPQVYLSHSVFVFPSLYEGFGMVLAEAMAAGIPIITTQAGIAKEWIKDKINGIVIPYQDSSAIYGALNWAKLHPGEMEDYGLNAKKLIYEMCQGENIKKRIEIYHNLDK